MKKRTENENERLYPTDGVATVTEAAEFLKLKPKAIYRRVWSGRFKLGNRNPGDAIRIPWKQLHEAAGTL